MVVEDDDPRPRAVADDDLAACARERAVVGEVPAAELDRPAHRPGDVHGAARGMDADIELVVGTATDEVERSLPVDDVGHDGLLERGIAI